MAWVVASAQPWIGEPTTWIHDVQYYYGAGERLNAGHELYAYSIGDRQLTVDPFYFAGPFLYPPLLGVLWRPLALLPYEPVVIAAWAIGLVVFLGSLVWLLRNGGVPVAGGVLLLIVPLVWTAWSGNISTILTPLIIWAWLALGRNRDSAAGAAIGFAAVLKLTPAFLAWWLLVTRRWTALRAAAVVAVASLALSAVGAGPGAYFDYWQVTSLVGRAGGTEASLTALLKGAGASPDVLSLVAPVVSIIGIAAVFLLRDRPRAAFAAAIATGVFASPVFNLTNVSLLLAAFVAVDRELPAKHSFDESTSPIRAPAG